VTAVADQPRNVLSTFGSWEAVYRSLPPDQLPWNAGGPDPDLVARVDAGRLSVGAALDVGTGPGHDAIFLARRGFSVTAVDLAPSAIALARDNARAAGVENEIDFEAADVLALPLPPAGFTLIYDRGCFHTLPPDAWAGYLGRLRDALAPDGQFLLRVRRAAPGDGETGPHPFTETSLRTVLSPFFRVDEIHAAVYAGPGALPSYFLALQRAAG
jgi:SAM-dependent methyltransferase